MGAGFFFHQEGWVSLTMSSVKNKYLLTMIDTAFSPLQKAQFFMKLIQIHQGDEWNRLFNTPLGQVFAHAIWLNKYPTVF